MQHTIGVSVVKAVAYMHCQVNDLGNIMRRTSAPCCPCYMVLHSRHALLLGYVELLLTESSVVIGVCIVS